MKIFIASALAASALSAFPAYAQGDGKPDLNAICAARACRTHFYDAVVRFDEKHYKTVPVTQTPYVLDDDSILIFPGETLAITFSIEDGKLAKPLFYKQYSAQLPAQIQIDEKPAANPDNVSLPTIKGELNAEITANMPPNTLIFSYGQLNGQKDMILMVNGNAPKSVKLDAYIFLLSEKGYKETYTSTCPLRTGIGLFEHWPYPLGPIILSHVRFMQAGEAMTCN